MTGQNKQEEKGNNSVVWPALYCPCPASPVHRGLQPSPPSKHSEEGSHYLLSDWGHLQVTWSQCPWSELCSDYAALARSCDHLQSRAALFKYYTMWLWLTHFTFPISSGFSEHETCWSVSLCYKRQWHVCRFWQCSGAERVLTQPPPVALFHLYSSSLFSVCKAQTDMAWVIQMAPPVFHL